MSTSPENSLSNFDLDLLLCPANTSSSSFQLSEITDYGYQTQDTGISGSSSHGYGNQNIEIMGTTHHNNYYMQNMGNDGKTNHGFHEQNIRNKLSIPGPVGDAVVKKSEYETLQRQFEKLGADYVSLQNKHDSKNKDYDAVKKQFAKLASDYANLHEENKEHALSSLNISTKCETLEKKEIGYLATIDTLNKQCQKYNLDILAQSKQFYQYQGHVEDLMTEIGNLKKNVQNEKNIGKDSRKMISNLTSNNQTLTDHLCLFACVIEGRKQLDKESRRLIKKYCKNTSSKKNTEIDNFENQSIDTGRGSSLALSDGDRSFYSPAYSITFSPFSTGTSSTYKDQSKMMRDASSSPIQMVKTLDISTSPIIFEKGLTSPPKKTFDVGTNTIIDTETKSPVVKTKSINIAESPIKFVTDTSTPVAKNITLDIASSPIEFADARSPVTKVNTVEFATSPTKYAETKIQVAKTITSDMATSPVEFVDVRSSRTKSSTVEIATSPVEFADTKSKVVKTITLDMATSPVEFTDARPRVTKTNTLEIATSPVEFPDARPTMIKANTLEIATSPIKFADTEPCVRKIITLDIATSPVEFADARPTMTKASTLEIARSPVQFADARPPVTKTNTLKSDISPVKLVDTKTRVANSNALEMASPIETAAARYKEAQFKKGMIPVAESLTNTLKRSHIVSPIKCAGGKSPPAKKAFKKLKTKDLSASYHIEDSVKNRYTGSDAKNISCMDIGEKLKEIVSKQSDQSQDDPENDWEIKMILSKQIMSWDMLSPMSLTPEGQDDEQTQLENKEINNETPEQSHLTSKKEAYKEPEPLVHLSKEERYREVSNLVINTPQHVVTSDNIDELMKDPVEMADRLTNNSSSKHTSSPILLQNDLAFESTINVNIEKTHRTSTKGKKLTKLQKIYKANIPKAKIKTQIPPFVKKQCVRPKPYSISPIKTRSQIIDKVRQLDELNIKKKLLIKKQNTNVEISKEIIEYNNTDTPQPESQTISSHILPHKHTSHLKPPEADQNRRILSTETQPNSSCDHPRVLTNPIQELNKVSSESQLNSKYDTSNILMNQPERGPSLRLPTKPRIKAIARGNSLVLPSDQAEKNFSNERVRSTGHSTSNNSSNSDYELLSPKIASSDSTTELIRESERSYSYPNPQIKRIARTKKSISTNLVLPSNHADSNNSNARIDGTNVNLNNNDKSNAKVSCTSDTVSHNDNDGVCELTPHGRVANDSLSVNRQNTADIVEANVETKNSSVIDSKIESENHESASSSISIAVSRSNSMDMHPILQTKPASNHQISTYENSNEKNIVEYHNVCDPKELKNGIQHDCWTKNILDIMIYKYGIKYEKYKQPQCLNDEAMALKIKNGLDKCVNNFSKRGEYNYNIMRLTAELKLHSEQEIIGGLNVLLTNPANKSEFVPVKEDQSRPTASKPEMTLIYVIQTLQSCGTDLWDLILDSCEFMLFRLDKGKTPDFDVIDIVSHFYANICKHRNDISRMWMFMLNAMYCLSFKAIPLLKHCLDLVPEVLPHSTTILEPGLAPLIRCFVFLIYYYNCNDRYGRAEDIKRLLKYKHEYNIQDENDTTILFFLKESIVNLKENKLQKSMLELCLLIVAKRRGTQWSHKNIVQKFLIPMIKGEIEVSYTAKRFCIITIGEILKPYNKSEMTVHSEEVVNLLIRMFEQSQIHDIKEDIIRSLISMNMQKTFERVNSCLYKWNPPSVSSELENVLKSYVLKNCLRTWQSIHQNYYTEI